VLGFRLEFDQPRAPRTRQFQIARDQFHLVDLSNLEAVEKAMAGMDVVVQMAADPRPALALLERLRDDPTTLVRRSVANHLNDLSKDDPALALATCRRWLRGASPERRALVHHALRTLLRTRHPEALALVGHGGRPQVALGGLTARPRRVAVGGQVVISFTLASRAARAQPLRVDLAVHFVKPGEARQRLPGGQPHLAGPRRGGLAADLLACTAPARPTRRHRVELVVNGATLGRWTRVVSLSRAA
jgi:hypothetical protein